MAQVDIKRAHDPRAIGDPEAAFGPTLALTVTLALGAAGLLLAALTVLVEPEPITGIDLSQRQSAETAIYVGTFGVLLPLALLAGPRLAARVRAAQGGAALSALAALLLAGLALAVLLTRGLGRVGAGDGSGVLLAIAGGWAAATVAALARASRARPWPPLQAAACHAAPLWIVCAALLAAVPWTVAHRDSISPLPLVLGAVAAAVALVLAARPRRLRLPARAGAVVDAVGAVLIPLVVVNLVLMRPEDPASGPVEAYKRWVVQYHDNLLLGPANHVLGGGAMLVDGVSQYGVGSIYFLAGWFNIAPIGYGTLGLLDGLLTALLFLAGYAVLRMAGCSRLLAWGALGTALVALVLARPYPVGALVQEGPLRFGLPMLLVVAAVAAARWPGGARLARGVTFATVGVASIWALEAFAITVATFAALVCLEALLAPREERRRGLARAAIGAGVACVCAHALLALGTLVFAGELPDWGEYIDYLDAFLFGELGDLTYDFSRWSPGIAVGAVYVASAAAIVLLLRRRSSLLTSERPAVVALAGLTAYGAAQFMYLVDRSADHVVAYVSLPALLVCVLWLALLLRSDAAPQALRLGALALALSSAVLLVSVAWSGVGRHLDETALAHVVPGGESPGHALDRLWNFPPIQSETPAGERVLRRFMPDESRSLIILAPDLETELLMRTGRMSRTGLIAPWGDSFVPEERLPAVRAAVARLREGDRMLVDRRTLDAFAASRGRSLRAVLHGYPAGGALASLQIVALRGIERRFALRPVHRDRTGYVVMRLERRR